AITSPWRISPACPHFQECSGCHFQHCSQEHEILFKKDALFQHFRRQLPIDGFNAESIVVHPAPSRLHYRNRLQLHYRKNSNELGFIDPWENKIIPVPSCVIGNSLIQQKMRELYDCDHWHKFLHNAPSQGHIELFTPANKELIISVNRPYAAGGFEQVNPSMNEQLAKQKWPANFLGNGVVLDLFGGNGNFSRKLEGHKVFVVDINSDFDTPQTSLSKHQEFVSLDLYQQNAPQNLRHLVKDKVDLLLLDPPRSGLKNLDSFVQFFSPQIIVYLSCEAATMTRDLKALFPKYHLQEIHLYDFFPSTYHFESLAILSIVR
ncbi:MAG: hypothetical protein WCG27_09665, partial [Pseudomonadota bacterium]